MTITTISAMAVRAARNRRIWGRDATMRYLAAWRAGEALSNRHGVGAWRGVGNSPNAPGRDWVRLWGNPAHG